MSRGRSWIFRYKCGCAFGLVDEGTRSDTPSKAWKSMFPTVRERDKYLDMGVTADLQPWEEYQATVYDQLRDGCPHQGGTG